MDKARYEKELIERLSKGLTKSREFYASIGVHTARVYIYFVDGKAGHTIEWLNVKRFALDDKLEDLCLTQDSFSKAEHELKQTKHAAKKKLRQENTLVTIDDQTYHIKAREFADNFVAKEVKNLTASDDWGIR